MAGPEKLQRSFYQKDALSVCKGLLGKLLVFNSPAGQVSGIISEVEAYPAFSDEVSHGNKRTPRTEILYREGGFAYVYLVYGVHYQFGISCNRKDIPEVAFIRGAIPKEGIGIMRENFGMVVKDPLELANSPGKLCKSFGIDKRLYGEDLTGSVLFVEDSGETLSWKISSSPRIGINRGLKGAERKLRFSLKK